MDMDDLNVELPEQPADMSAADLAAARGDVVLSQDDEGSADVDGASDGQAAGEPESQDEGGADDGGHADDEGQQRFETVPKSRFDEVIEQRNVGREQLSTLQEQNKMLMQMLQQMQGGKHVDHNAQATPQQQGQQQAPEFDLQAKLKEHSSAIFHGDEDGAAKVMGEIIFYQNEQARKEAQAAISNYERTLSMKSANEVADTIMARNKAAFEADPEMVDDFVSLRIRYEKAGLDAKDALVKAEKRLFGGAADARAQDDKGSAVFEERRKAALARNAQAATQQPAAMTGGQGQRTRKTAATALDLSEKEYSSMSSEEKARARGDIV